MNDQKFFAVKIRNNADISNTRKKNRTSKFLKFFDQVNCIFVCNQKKKAADF